MLQCFHIPVPNPIFMPLFSIPRASRIPLHKLERQYHNLCYWKLSMCMHVYVCVCASMCVHVCVCVCTCVCVSGCMWVRTHNDLMKVVSFIIACTLAGEMPCVETSNRWWLQHYERVSSESSWWAPSFKYFPFFKQSIEKPKLVPAISTMGRKVDTQTDADVCCLASVLV